MYDVQRPDHDRSVVAFTDLGLLHHAGGVKVMMTSENGMSKRAEGGKRDTPTRALVLQDVQRAIVRNRGIEPLASAIAILGSAYVTITPIAFRPNDEHTSPGCQPKWSHLWGRVRWDLRNHRT